MKGRPYVLVCILAMLLASEAGELLAEYRWVASGDADGWSKDPENLARIQAEIGDVGIALLMLCDRVGIDVAEAILRKVEQNKLNYPSAESKGVPERDG